ncbi:MAG: LysR family transcriptional regulator [Chroococcidiopsidaceae cyanobacterium CP_BM_ER_R8_30]|nr:LysR family transcriptional regulator [Chroococcidiopsidaceae cyanobacterium CP_BM_ER_R8_30]
MELRHLHYFIAVAEELHFSRAAARLHIAQPPLSQQIQNLEAELGVKLFERTKRQVQLTAAGQLFLEHSYQVLAQIEQAVQSAQRVGRGEVGQLVIGFVGGATYGIFPDILRTFRTRFPEVELVLYELTTIQQIQALRERRIEVGFGVRPLVEDSTLQFERIVQEPLMLVLPQIHPLASQSQVSLQAFAHEPFVLFPPRLGLGFYEQIISLCEASGFRPQIAQEAIQMQTIVGLVAAGFGVSLVPASVQMLHQPGVVYKSLTMPAPTVDLAVIWQCHNASPVLQAFLNVVREQASLKAEAVTDSQGNRVDGR